MKSQRGTASTSKNGSLPMYLSCGALPAAMLPQDPVYAELTQFGRRPSQDESDPSLVEPVDKEELAFKSRLRSFNDLDTGARWKLVPSRAKESKRTWLATSLS